MISLSSFAFNFKFNLLGLDINVKNYGTYAKSCNEYKNPTQSNKRYSGNLPTTIFSGIFRIKPASDPEFSVTTTYGVLDWRIYYYNVNLSNTGYFSFVSFANYAFDTGNYSAYIYVK